MSPGSRRATGCRFSESSAQLTKCSRTVSLSQGVLRDNSHNGYQQYAVLYADVSAKVLVGATMCP